MTTKWSYSGDPSASHKDAVRFAIGDTEPKQMVLTDAEILYALQAEGSVAMASITCAESAMARFVLMVSEQNTEDKKTKNREYQQRVDNYAKLIKQLKARRARGAVAVYCGGLSETEKQTKILDTDLVQPDFRKEMMEDTSVLPGTNPRGPY